MEVYFRILEGLGESVGEGYKTWKSLSQWVYSEEHNQAKNNLKSIF